MKYEGRNVFRGVHARLSQVVIRLNINVCSWVHNRIASDLERVCVSVACCEQEKVLRCTLFHCSGVLLESFTRRPPESKQPGTKITRIFLSNVMCTVLHVRTRKFDIELLSKSLSMFQMVTPTTIQE